MQPFFITSSGTDIGKTLVTTTLCWQLRHQGKKVTALKPVISGYDPRDEYCDSALILKSCGLTPTPALMETISPWRFSLPISPNMAASKEGQSPVSLAELTTFCHEHASLPTDILLVEGVGGVMVPLNEEHTVLDWIGELNWPVILVVGSYLGALSHTLTAVEVLHARGQTIRAIMVSSSPASAVSSEDTVTTLGKFISKDIPIIKIPRVAGKTELWRNMPLVSWICDNNPSIIER